MEQDPPGAKEPSIEGQYSHIPSSDNMQTLDNGNATLDQANQAPQAAQAYTNNTMAPTIIADATVSTPTAATPPVPASTNAGLTNAAVTHAVPKDGKSAGQADFPQALPAQAQAHGAPVRQYLNENVTPHLLEVTKHLAAHRPEKPLKFVAEYFAEKSRQIEGTD